MENSRIKWIGFDLDGTLVNTAGDIAHAVNNMLKRLELNSVTVGQVETWIGNGIEKTTERALTQVKAQYIDVKLATAYVIEEYNRCVTNQSRLYPNVVATLEKLKILGLKLALVTNKDKQHTLAITRHLNIYHYFDSIVCSNDDTGHKKPHPEPLLAALRTMDVTIDEGCYVGDSINDVKTARNAGCKVITVDYGYNHGVPIALAEPDRIIGDLAELQSIFRAG
ncbi:HAD family hydrolase [Shewanella sp. CG12_big_fil_rev_8_21_14_0_65_47_15]|jgi:phosphoglycolate phosphatase|uniref:HAD family hydrolase n=1 Tax=Shewanella sp. CG12_big_fil_rev_8_21_14_0_65_47_15 TaxID=1975537 RepID=UPI000CB5C99A|nr:HAD family hydrolase [Shewanella sp. CG12_big_fil_rev_8_21_14_0_65_47_15]PIW60841.1 MAG: phosphoglycolate phosphatase [Shewanella sp. CG12_big_fil_rev_8_21_14_0_65_47_15]